MPEPTAEQLDRYFLLDERDRKDYQLRPGLPYREAPKPEQ
jgi:hypothetical protein